MSSLLKYKNDSVPPAGNQYKRCNKMYACSNTLLWPFCKWLGLIENHKNPLTSFVKLKSQ